MHLFPIRCGSQYTQLGLLGLDEMKPVNLLTLSLAHCNPSLPLLLISNETLGGSSDLEFVLQQFRRNAAEYCDGSHVFEPHSLG